MKRLLALLLILAFSITFVSCGETTDISSVPEESANEASEENAFEPNPEVQKIQSYLSVDINRDYLAKNVFRGMEYTFSRTTDSGYPDNGGHKITDGHTVKVFDTNSYVAWSGYSSVHIDFDLGNNQRPIAEISIGTLRLTDYGIGSPKYVAVLASNDGKEYTEISRIYAPSDIPPATKYDFVFSFPKALSARYIRFYFDRQDKSFLFVDEISAYEYCADGTVDTGINVDTEQVYTINDFYNYNLNKGESDIKVSPSDPDYNAKINLAALEGVDFQIEHFDPLAPDHSNTSKEKIGLLTDGVLHGDIHGDYFIFYRGGGRHVVADLGVVMSVKGSNIAFFDNWGAAIPPVYYISLSEDGESWVTVFSEYNENYGNWVVTDTKKIAFENEYRARYVRLTFPTVPDNSISSSVYIGEWEIIGKKNPEGAVTAKEYTALQYGRYPDTKEFGINNILFAPITDGYGIHCTEKHMMSEEAAYIYLASFDKNGSSDGIFFDSIAFSTRGELNNHKNRTEGMNFFYDELFYDGINLDAVEAAKGRLNSELNRNDKVKIWICVNSPAIGDTFNGTTVEDLDDFNACLKWQVDETIRKFAEKDYRNLEFVGFYWQHELVRPDTFDKEAMIDFNEYVHSLGYLTFWCPYYNAPGIWLNREVGFDISCLQPNYMFYDTEPTRMRTAAELAKLYGMCVEIEIESGTQSKEAVALYREYLAAGYEYGFMNSVKVYYQGGLPGAYYYAHGAEDELTKSVYNDTVLYSKGLLDEAYTKGATSPIDGFSDCAITVKNGAKESVSIGNIGDIAYKISLSPMYGSIGIDFDGTITYRSMKGYKGEDEIRIEFYDGISETKEIIIKVTVTE